MLSETTNPNDLKIAQEWDTDRYQQQHNFVWKYGSSLIDDFLDPQSGETIVDLGCGTGELTKELADRGVVVRGIDADPSMIETAKQQFPSLDFSVGDARTFTVETPVDAVFSNAALHWVKEADLAVAAIAQALKVGGRFVAEFGGKGNVEKITGYLESKAGTDKNPWYFPSIAEYASLLEEHGLEVTYANLYDRPTPLSEGENGLRNWILMFGGVFLEELSDERKDSILKEAETYLREDLHTDDGWFADYRRLRIVATKKEDGQVCLS